MASRPRSTPYAAMKALLSRGSAHTKNDRNPRSPSSNAAKWPPRLGTAIGSLIYLLETGQWVDRVT